MLNKKIDLREVFLFIAILLLGLNFILFSAFSTEETSSVMKLAFRVIAAGLLGMIVIFDRQISISLLAWIFICSIIFLITFNVFTLNLVFLFLIVSAMRTISIDKTMNYILFAYIIMFIIHIAFFNLNIIQNDVVQYDGRIRASYGFGNVNKLGMFYYCFANILLYEFTRNSKANFMKKLLLILGIGLSIFFILVSGSRTSLLCLALTFILIFINTSETFAKYNRSFLNYIILICYVITLGLALNFSSKLNEILSYRPELFNLYLHEISSNFSYFTFGYFGITNYPVDNSYLVFIGSVGCIISSLCVLASYILIRNSYVDKKLIPIVLSSLLFGIFENSLLRVELLLPAVIVFVLFYNDNYINKTGGSVNNSEI